MAKHIVRYLPEGDGTLPKFIEQGGHILDTSTGEAIGLSVDEDKRHLPSTVFKLTRAQIKTRMSTLGYNKKEDDTTMSDAELDTAVQEFLDAKGLGGLA
jgi:hypothetical protein